jgi:hypothetical protein
MATVRFCVSQWAKGTDLHAPQMLLLCDYVHIALICGFRAATIGEHIANRWPDLIPGGAAGAVRLVEISVFAAKAHERGLVDEDIGIEIDFGWPDVTPGGVEVTTGTDGTIWVTDRSRPGECRQWTR